MTIIDDPRITQIENTGYLNDVQDGILCECCEEIIPSGDWVFTIGNVTYCERCIKCEFGKFV